MAIKADDVDKVSELLGTGGEVQVVPIFIPLQAFQLLLNAGKERGMSVSDIIARSIELFLTPKQDIPLNKEQNKPTRVPDLVIKRRR